MPISSLPDECFSDILSFLDKKSLYKCLFVNRYYCKFTIPLIWREPFIKPISKRFSLINTLLACFNEDEISSLIPCAIKFNNNQSPLFEYGKFVRIIDHYYCVKFITKWLKLFYNGDKDCMVRKLVDAVYHMIMRQGSNLQEFFIEDWNNDLPKLSIFTTYEPGITNLRTLKIKIKKFDHIDDGESHENIIKFLSMVTKFCNGIVKFELSNAFLNSFMNIIKLQPLESILLDIGGLQSENAKKIINTLEFRSETLKKLSFNFFNFQGIDLSFISKFDCLERLDLVNFCGVGCYELQNLLTKKYHLKELKLETWRDDPDVIVTIINSFCGQTLQKLSLNIVTPETVEAVRESCPNIKFLHISIKSERFLSSIIPPICELSSLKILNIGVNFYCFEKNYCGLLAEILGDNLKFVEYLLLYFSINFLSFKYFTDNCKANLKKLIICKGECSNLDKDYLIHVSNYQKVHNSLKLFGIDYGNGLTDEELTDEELAIVDLLKNQGVDVTLKNKDYCASLNEFNFFKVFY